jgi:polysaccharide pyruvyl transferase WcaK-like protein
MDKSSFIHVRDQQSMEALIDAGVKRSIEVGPDLIVVLSDFFDPVEQRLRGRELLRRKGVEIGRPVVCVQTNPQPTERTIELIRQLSAYRERSGCEVILLPLGRCHGDAVYLKKLARDAGGAFRYVESESIFDDMAVLAGCDVFLGTSLHGNITAFSFGIPHIFGPIGVAKCAGFLDVTGLTRELKLESWSEASERLEMIGRLGRGYFSKRSVAAKQRVHAVFDLLLRSLTGTRELSDRTNAGGLGAPKVAAGASAAWL